MSIDPIYEHYGDSSQASSSLHHPKRWTSGTALLHNTKLCSVLLSYLTNRDSFDPISLHTMAKHHPDLVMCRKQPGVAIGRLCEKCEYFSVKEISFLPEKINLSLKLLSQVKCSQINLLITFLR